MKFCILPLLLIVLVASDALADEPSLVQVSPRSCSHGLHLQPDGPFAAYIFCDDAQGINLGIIMTAPAVYPGEALLKLSRDWDAWNPTQRFWQDQTWAADITGLFWSPSKRYLYVSTSGVYGDGGVFKLDLIKRSFDRIAPTETSDVQTQIESFDPKASSLTIQVEGPNSHKKAIKISVE